MLIGSGLKIGLKSRGSSAVVLGGVSYGDGKSPINDVGGSSCAGLLSVLNRFVSAASDVLVALKSGVIAVLPLTASGRMYLLPDNFR